MRISVVFILVLFTGCSNEPDWKFTYSYSKADVYIDKKSIEYFGDLVRYTKKQEFYEPYTSIDAKIPYRKAITRLSLNCKDLSWTMITLETFDEKGNPLESRKYNESVYYKIPNPIGYIPKLCSHTL